jgi:hypothetical protein
MRLTSIGFLLSAAVAACGVIPADNTARMPLNQFGGPVLNQNQAIGLSSWALKNPATTRGNPELAARAIAAEDWLAGQDMLAGNFGSYQPVNEVPWGELRREVRGAIGVAPGAPSQVVVDRLLAASEALHAGDKAGAEAQLQSPVFSLGADGTLAALANLPPFPDRELAYADLGFNENREEGCGLHC